jgi:hypothetical protein
VYANFDYKAARKEYARHVRLVQSIENLSRPKYVFMMRDLYKKAK